MKTVLFEVQHLYYLPQFLPIITELISRTNYKIFVSLSHYSSSKEKNEFLSLSLIKFNEEKKVRKIITV